MFWLIEMNDFDGSLSPDDNAYCYHNHSRKSVFGATEQPSSVKLPVLIRVIQSLDSIFDLRFERTPEPGFNVLIKEWWDGNMVKLWCGRRGPRLRRTECTFHVDFRTF